MSINIRLLRTRPHYWLAIILFLAAVGVQAQPAPEANAKPFCEDGIKISWNRSADADEYVVLRVTGDGELQTVCSTTDNECKLKGLKEDSSYSFYVDAVVDGQTILSKEPISAKTYGEDDCEDDDTPRSTPTPKPSVDTCSYLPADIIVRNFGIYSTQCKQVGAAGVGNAELIAQGVLDAVDIWNIVDAGILVCFRNQGALKFLDASTSPRALSDLATQSVDGMTCATIDRAGTVVLMQGSSMTSPVIEPPPQAAPAAPNLTSGPSATQPDPIFPNARGVVDCPVTTSDILNMRQGPGIQFAIILEIPYQTRLTASARAGEWYQVDYAGQVGWIFFKLVSRHGNCNWA